MLGILDRILKLLSVDDRAHSTLDISRRTGLTIGQVEKTLALLSSIEFVSFDGQRAVIDPSVKRHFLDDND